jgi:hypothetical protein
MPKKKKKRTNERTNCRTKGDFLSLARNFSWVHYAGAENRKGDEGSY